jgi:hypothetical protein
MDDLDVVSKPDGSLVLRVSADLAEIVGGILRVSSVGFVSDRSGVDCALTWRATDASVDQVYALLGAWEGDGYVWRGKPPRSSLAAWSSEILTD